MVNNTTTAKFLGQSVTGGASAFTDLTDVPAAYTGQGGKVVAVKSDVSGLEFVAATGTDEKVKYDANDPTAGYVADKVVAGTGITVAEGSGGNENKLVVTNNAPDQTVAITAGTNIDSVTGTYPNFTVNAATQGGSYTLPVATASVLGGVKKGDRVSIDANGVISADVQAGTYSLPTATDSVLGGIKVGTTLGIAAGVLNYTNPNPTPYSLPTAAAATLGGIKVGDRLTIAAGVLSADVQTTDISGKVTGPAANTADYIPQRDGANSKTLKDGLAVPAGGLAGLTALGDKVDKVAGSRLITTAEGTVLGNTSNTNSGDNAANTSSLPIAGGILTGGLVLVAGTTTVQPIKMVAGTNLTAAVSGVFEYNGTDLFFTIA